MTSDHDRRNAEQIALLRESAAQAHYCPGCTGVQAEPGLCSRCKEGTPARAHRPKRRVFRDEVNALLMASSVTSGLPYRELEVALRNGGQVALADGSVVVQDGLSYYHVGQLPSATAPALNLECFELLHESGERVTLRAASPLHLADAVRQEYLVLCLDVPNVPLLPRMALAFAQAAWEGASLTWHALTLTRTPASPAEEVQA